MKNGVIHLSSWTKTWLGSPIELYQKTYENKPMILFIGGVHGDEPTGVRLAQDLLRWLNVEKTQVPNYSWTLIPCLNPDGLAAQQRTNHRGVDLNRNFPTHDWSPQYRKPRYFPGPHPQSEIEVASLVKKIDELNPRVIFHFHSWRPAIIYTGEEGKVFAEYFTSKKYPLQEDIGHPTPGSLGQYGWYQKKIPVICFEEADGTEPDNVWGHFEAGFRRLLYD